MRIVTCIIGMGNMIIDCGDSAMIMCIMLALTMISRLIPVRGLSLTVSMLKITKDVVGFPARDPG